MINLTLNYILMVITLVYASALFCDIYYKTKSSKAKFSILFLPLSIIILSTGFLLELSSEGNFIYTLFPCLLIYSGLCFLGYSWFVFSSAITFKNKKNVFILNIFGLVPPTLILLLIVTNPLHGLLYILPHDPVEMQFSAEYLCILILGGVYALSANIILLISFLRNNSLSLKLKIVFFIVLAFIESSFIVRIFYLKHLEIVPICLLIGYHIILYSISFRYKLFDIVPRSISSIVQNMDQSILITNTSNYVVNFNASFINAFEDIANIKEADPLGVFVEKLKKSTVLDEESQNVFDLMLRNIDKNASGKLHVYNPVNKWYFVSIQHVLNSKQKIIGKLISFNDITIIQNLNYELKHKNCALEKINFELKNTNEKILKHTLMAEELAITRERNRILSELHDSIGQAYTSNLALARCAETLLLSNRTKEALDCLEDMTSITNGLLDTISSSVNNKETIIQQQPLKDLLKKLFYSYRKSGIAIEFKLNTEIEKLEHRIRHNIYRICQESINNSLKHGSAKNICISIEEENNKITLEIADDGIGCDSIYKGVGLKGIEYRISEIDGEVMFVSDKFRQQGFVVKAVMPLRKEPKQ